MTTPIRIQRKRVKGWRLPPNTICVTRPGPWGNPFVVGEVSDASKLGYQTPKELCGVMVRDAAHAADLFNRWLHSLSDVALGWRISLHVLRGKNLACFCPVWQCEAGHKFGDEIKLTARMKYCPTCSRPLLRAPCHADHLLELANA